MKKYLFLFLVFLSVKSASQTVILQNFENQFAGGWTTARLSGTYAGQGWSTQLSSSNASYPYNPGRMAVFHSADIGANERWELKSPNFTLDQAKTYTLTFKMYRSSTAPLALDVIQVSTPAILGSVYRHYQQAPAILATYWQTITYTISNSSGGFLNFVGRSQNGDDIFIDDILLVEDGACNPPTALTFSDITATSATLNFSAPTPTPTSGYEYYLSTVANAPLSTAIPNGSLSGSGQTINDLTDDTNYYVWVRTKCSQYFVNNWTVSSNFRTTCGTDTIPFTEDFSTSVVPNIPFCTTTLTQSGTSSWSSVVDGGNKKIWIRKNTTTPVDAWFMTKPMTLVGGQTYRLSFSHVSSSATDTSNLRVFYQNTATQYLNNIMLFTGIANTTAQTTTTNFTPATTGVYNLAFFVFNGVQTGTGALILDDISVTVAPCLSTSYTSNGWSNGEPDATKRATFARNYSATTDMIACGVTIINGVQVIFGSGKNLTVVNDIAVATTGNLTFTNGSYLFQIDKANNSGKINFRREASMKRLDYVYWSSPVADQTLALFSPQTLTNRFYTFNEATNIFQQTSGIMSTAKGYSIRAPNNFGTTASTFTGQFNGIPNNGDINIPISYTLNKGNGYNLIGNPYPSPVNATTFLNTNGGTLYFWTHQSAYNGTTLINGGVTNYASFNLSGAIAATVSGGNNILPNGTIQAGQGFMFKTDTDKSISFNNDMRIDDNAGQFFRTSQHNTATDTNKIWLGLKNSAGEGSQTLLAYLPNTTVGFDNGYDGSQINTTGNVLSTVLNNDNYAIQSRGNFSNSDVVKLNLSLYDSGSYALYKENTTGIFADNQDFFLKDNLLGTTHNLKQSPYVFVANAGMVANRFEIVYQSALSNNNNVFVSENVIVFEQNGLLNISATDDLKNVKVFDVQGRNIFEAKNINSKTTTLNGFQPQQQVLLLQITNSENQIVTKKVVF